MRWVGAGKDWGNLCPVVCCREGCTHLPSETTFQAPARSEDQGSRGRAGVQGSDGDMEAKAQQEAPTSRGPQDKRVQKHEPRGSWNSDTGTRADFTFCRLFTINSFRSGCLFGKKMSVLPCLSLIVSTHNLGQLNHWALLTSTCCPYPCTCPGLRVPLAVAQTCDLLTGTSYYRRRPLFCILFSQFRAQGSGVGTKQQEAPPFQAWV